MSLPFYRFMEVSEKGVKEECHRGVLQRASQSVMKVIFFCCSGVIWVLLGWCMWVVHLGLVFGTRVKVWYRMAANCSRDDNKRCDLRQS